MSLPSNPLSDAALDALISKERTRVVAPLTEWRVLSDQLRNEGIIRSGMGEQTNAHSNAHTSSTSTSHETMPAVALPQRRSGAFVRWGTRLVASAVLVGIGVVAGRGMTIGNEVVPVIKQAIANADSVATFESPEEAQATLTRAQTNYQRAAAYLAARDTSPQIIGGPEMYQERLVALDQMLATARERLRAAPADPVLNQYYQSAAGAREATIQQLGQTLPAGVKIGHY
jgi:hypothetical protein